jgi:hypothetical protein
MARRRLTRNFFVIILLVTFGLGAHTLILGHKVVSLPSAPELTGAVSQAIGTGSGGEVPRPEKDFNLTNVHRFSNGEWIVATIKPTKQNADSALVVLQRLQSQYRVVLGPGAAFDNSYLINLPKDVGGYLTSAGAIQ